MQHSMFESLHEDSITKLLDDDEAPERPALVKRYTSPAILTGVYAHRQALDDTTNITPLDWASKFGEEDVPRTLSKRKLRMTRQQSLPACISQPAKSACMGTCAGHSSPCAADSGKVCTHERPF